MTKANIKKQEKAIKALADEQRLQIVHIIKQGSCNASDLERQLPIKQSTLSHHMKILCDAGVVNCTQKGRWRYYSINKEGFQNVINALQSVIAD